jgi:hypothetical protein
LLTRSSQLPPAESASVGARTRGLGSCACAVCCPAMPQRTRPGSVRPRCSARGDDRGCVSPRTAPAAQTTERCARSERATSLEPACRRGGNSAPSSLTITRCLVVSCALLSRCALCLCRAVFTQRRSASLSVAARTRAAAVAVARRRRAGRLVRAGRPLFRKENESLDINRRCYDDRLGQVLLMRCRQLACTRAAPLVSSALAALVVVLARSRRATGAAVKSVASSPVRSCWLRVARRGLRLTDWNVFLRRRRGRRRVSGPGRAAAACSGTCSCWRRW